MKKFKHTKIGKFLTSPFAMGLIKTIPFGVGSLAGNVLDETKTSEAGSPDLKTIIPQVIKLIIYAVLAYFALTGAITFDEVDAAQDVINY